MDIAAYPVVWFLTFNQLAACHQAYRSCKSKNNMNIVKTSWKNGS